MADISQTIPEKYRVKFANQWTHVVQQKMAKLESAGIVQGDWSEKTYDFDSLGVVEFAKNNARFGSTTAVEMTGGNRRGFKDIFECAVKFSRYDDKFLGSLGEPRSEAMQAMAYAWNRAKDKEFIAKATASVYSTDPAAPAITLGASQRIGATFAGPGGTAVLSGLTPWKLLEAKNILVRGNVDLDYEDPVIVLSTEAETSLLRAVEAANNDVWADTIARPLNSNSGRLMGVFRIIRSNNLTNVAGTQDLLCFTQQAFRVSPQVMDTSISRLADKRNATQIYSVTDWGCVRRFEEHVVVIEAATVY